MDTWFTSDTHLFHGNIIKYCHRPFLNNKDLHELNSRKGSWHNGTWKNQRDNYRISQESIDMMDDELINNINSFVKKDDVLYHLGDLAFPGKHFRSKIKEYRDRINCDHVELILGNHDGCGYRPWLKNKCYCNLKNDTCYDIYADFFTTVSDYQFVKVNGQYFGLFHYAPAIWNKSHRGAVFCYGHSHSEAEPWLNKVMKGRRSIDVGVDNAYKVFGKYRPFQDKEILNLIGQGHSVGDHHINPNAPTEEELN